MSKLLSIGLIAGAIGVGSFQIANAGYRNRRHVCSGTPTATVRVEAAPAQTAPIPVTSGSLAAQTARTDGQSYRSFSAEPRQQLRFSQALCTTTVGSAQESVPRKMIPEERV